MSQSKELQMVLPLIPMQKGMLYHYLLDRDSNAYFEQMAFQFTGKLELPLFEESYNYILQRYDAFRTVFIHEGIDEPVQVVLKERKGSIQSANIAHLSNTEKEAFIEDYMKQDREKGFDLSKDILFRISVLELDSNCCHVIISNHHIIMDGWCLGKVLNELFTVYHQLKNKQPVQLGKVYPYSHFVRWLAKQDKEEALDYWRSYLDGYAEKASLPQESSAADGFEQQLDDCYLSRELTAALNELSKMYQVTLNNTVQVIWAILLQRYNRCDDIVFGSVVSGRPSHIEGVEEMVGLFINTVPVRVQASPNQAFSDLLKQVWKQFVASENYHYVSLADIQAASELKQELLDHLLVFQNYPIDTQLDHHEVQRDAAAVQDFRSFEQTSYDFNVTIVPGEELRLNFNYNGLKYSRDAVANIGEHFRHIAEQVVGDPDIYLNRIELITEAEKLQILQQFNATARSYELNQTTPQLFEQQAEQYPDQTAVVFKQEKLTYRELNERANQLAGWLRKKGVQPDSIVGIMLDRSLDLLIAVMGVLKAGGAYLPIDPQYPQERVQYILDDSETSLLITDRNSVSTAAFHKEVVYMDEPEISKESIANPESSSAPHHLAYVIYTSGTTGLPKGVLIEHRNLVNATYAWREEYGLDRKRMNLLQMASFSFDVFAGDVSRTLLNGGTLVLCPAEAKLSPADTYDLLVNHNIHIFESTPALILPLMEYVYEHGKALPSLDLLILGSDSCSSVDFEKLLCRFGQDMRIINSYGVTEACIDSSYYEADSPRLNVKGHVPIGRPLPNMKLYIVDADRRLMPVGIDGELCIGGAGVARGYMNKPELTAERFVPNPFVPGERMYCTGDYARWLPTGDIQFIGREDTQIKIRGYRIELSEITARLLEHSAIERAVVIAREEGGQPAYLCAYIVPRAKWNAAELRAYLQQFLPEYMLPSQFLALEALPLTPNGKVDTRALPEPEGGTESGTEYAPARNELEEKLVEIWEGVLNKRRIGIRDHFFVLGGHSLKATVLVSRIHKHLGLELPLREVFQRPTIEQMAEYLQTAVNNSFEAIPIAPLKEFYPVSFAQRRMYVVSQLEEHGINYNMPNVLRVEGPLDPIRLQASFRDLMQRHEALRTSFAMVDGELVQRIHEQPELRINFMAEEVSLEAQIDAFIQPFDLGQAPLLRVGVIRRSEQEHILLIDMHHIISDGLTTDILLHDWLCLYENQGDALPKLRIQYKDYAQWQSEWLQSDSYKEQERYWLETLKGDIPVLNLPVDYPRPAVQQFAGNVIEFSMDKELTAKLKELMREEETTLYMTLLAAYNLLLSKYSSQEDIMVGSVVAGRHHSDLESVAGMFVNTLIMRNKVASSHTVQQLLQSVKDNCLKAFENQDYPYEELIEKLGVQRDLSRNPLFDTMFIVQSVEQQAQQPASVQQGLRVTPYPHEHHVSKFDLTLMAVDAEDEVLFSLEYCTKLFNEDTVRRMAGHFCTIIGEIVRNKDKRVAEIELLTSSEREIVQYEFNRTYAEFPKDTTIQALFEEQAKRTPDRTALLMGEERLTYSQLNERAAQLGYLLRSKGIGTECIVGIMMERSFEMMAGVLGILMAGGAYLPIDPAYPAERINYLLKDSGTKLLLTCGPLPNGLQFDGEILDLETSPPAFVEAGTLPRGNASDLAYVIYTSGSTGQPKGVMIEQAGVVNVLFSLQQEYPLGEQDRYLLKTNYTFDVSVTELFGWIPGGGSLVILPPEDEKDPEKLISAIEKNQVTHINFVPSMLQLFAAGEHSLERISSLKYILIAGEPLPHELVKKLYQRLPAGIRLENIYGPTEGTIYATKHSVGRECAQIPIGRPLDNVRIYILNQEQHLQPIGIPGELCIAGEGVARGYLNRAELTLEKFAENPYEPGQRMYRSGDLARWLPDGSIEYMGRLDHQVKIRGYRIELGEITEQMRRHPAIKDVVVMPHAVSDGDTSLVAYLVSDQVWSITEVRQHLSITLPEYMIPSYVIQIERLPLTASGKVDRNRLPKPDGLIRTHAAYVPPRTLLELQLERIWREVLGIKRAGINDSFFELGGHSLKATAMLSRMQRELQIEVPLRIVFQRKTIQELAAYIEEHDLQNKYSSIPAVPEREYYPVSSAQKRIYMVSQVEEEDIGYNLPVVQPLSGDIDPVHFRAALEKMIVRHEALRTSFDIAEGELVQIVHPHAELAFEIIETDESKLQETITAFVRPFDLSAAPLARFALIKTSENRTLFLYDMHHIISDAASLSVFNQELLWIYENGELPPLRIQYKDYAVWQQQVLKADLLAQQEQYWLKQFEGEIPVLDLPTDYPRPSVQQFDGGKVSFEWSSELTHELRKISAAHGTTLFSTLLAAFSILLTKYTGQEDNVIGTVLVGRPHSDLENLMGMFVKTVPIRSLPAGSKAFPVFLKEVQEQILLAQDHQDYPFEELVEKLNVQRDLSRHPLFDVMITMLTVEAPDHMDDSSVDHHETGEEYEFNISKFDLALDIIEEPGSLKLAFEYSTSLFKKSTIQRMAGHFTEIIYGIVSQAQVRIAELNMITQAEKRQILHDFNDTAMSYPSDKTIMQCFEQQVNSTPDHPMLYYKGEAHSYAQVNGKANQLANRLRAEGVGRGSLVGIMAERSVEYIVGVLAVLKAGGAYIPVDPSYPRDRIAHIFEDSQASLLLMNGRDVQRAPAGHTIVLLDDPLSYQGSADNQAMEGVSAYDRAYIIYTSGSTGLPKGVIIRQNSVINLAQWFHNTYNLTKNNKVIQMTNISFDVSVLETLVTFLHGGTLFIPDAEIILDRQAFYEYVNRHRIQVCQFVPVTLQELVAHSPRMESLQVLISGGDKLEPSLVNQVVSKGYRLFNHYGPTETTVDVLHHPCALNEETVLLGRPFGNVHAYVLNALGQLQPIGVPGELCIAGACVAEGYLNQPELTAAKFIDNPFVSGERLYRTGDAARWNEAGELEFLGRLDNQVKIRGFRIEIGEVESRLLTHESIQEAIVIAKVIHGSKQLCAYVKSDQEMTTSQYRAILEEHLPHYMIPSFFIRLESFPLTPNGKVDRKALPIPEGVIYRNTEYVAPRNATERKLVELFAEGIGIPEAQISMHDNFFELGGHSLVILKLLAKTYVLQWPLTIKDFYICKNIEQLAAKIDGTLAVEEEPTTGLHRPQTEWIQRKAQQPVQLSGEQAPLDHVLLTGATGFLGIHLLYELLTDTGAEIHCIIRGKDRFMAQQRLVKKLHFYFPDEADEQMNFWLARIHVYPGDVTKADLGLSPEVREQLGHSVDSVIHTAALVKHYGYYEDFYRMNVQGTAHVAEFCQSYNLRMHHISTTSVAGSIPQDRQTEMSFTESSFYIGQNYDDNLYIRSKFEAEGLIYEAMEKGLQASIYRVGNLTGRYGDGAFQENMDENMFYNRLKSFIQIGIAIAEMAEQTEEFTPIDSCAEAILKIVRTKEAAGNVFHIFNPRPTTYALICEALQEAGYKMEQLSEAEAASHLEELMKDESKHEWLSGFMADRPDAEAEEAQINVDVAAPFTQHYLGQLGFDYPLVNQEYIQKLVNYMYKSEVKQDAINK
ncbi:non-ribosomal peptide synthetase [Paenibacillus ihumii]|uniref:non-ribosomal peptide synthetase n=1 Tax=Paenibacillus ihumii TaxID=687436 RepID=UPI000AB99428|nr:non-ribosomal peptide synthetase [Paenibacillus ihumii]